MGSMSLKTIEPLQLQRFTRIVFRAVVIILPIVNIPPAPRPHTALAAIKLSMLCAKAHQIVANVKTTHEKIYGIFLPVTSLTRPYRGWKLVEVNRKEVDSHDASSDA